MVIFLFLKTITENASERFVICTELKRTDSLVCSRATEMVFFGYFSNKTLLAPAFQMGQLVAFVISLSLNYNRHFVLFFF